MRTGNCLCLQLRCEQSRVFLWLPELCLLMGKEADSASAGEPVCTALQGQRHPSIDVAGTIEAHRLCIFVK